VVVTGESAGSMKATVHERYRPPDVLELREVENPVIGDDQVLVRVHASSVNPVDWYGVSGLWLARLPNALRKPKDPRVGFDVAGRVEAVGPAVSTLRRRGGVRARRPARGPN
jgi:NADPH:quinone reductase-like Zn-dependent oxidoreductase